MAFADRLEAGLKAKGFEPLIDRDEIYAFEDWWKRIQSLIAQAELDRLRPEPGLGRIQRLRQRGRLWRVAQ